jgi:transporter family-2 protein
VLFMLLGGLCIALQSPTNALLGQALGSPLSAALVSFVVGTVFLAVVTVALRQPMALGPAARLPWYAWLGGVYGAVLVASIAYAARKIGVASSLTIALASQLVLAVALDHFGVLGLPRQPVTWLKLAGLAMVMGGALLIRR